MNRLTRSRWLVAALALASGVLLAVSLKFPLWHIRMEAPQYRGQEALKVSVFPGSMRGDLREIRVLNQYIGVHIPDRLPQTTWLPVALLAAGVLGAGAGFLPRAARRLGLVIIPALLSVALLVGAGQAQWQMYEIGHHRDQHTPLRGFQDFTPPLLGSSRIAQFEIHSGFDWGAWFVGGAIALQLAGAWLSRQRRPGFSSVSNLPSSGHPGNVGNRLEACPTATQ